MVYYNEWDAFAAQWLRNLGEAGEIRAGHVDERSIVDVRAADLAGYKQCHFFAGIGGWPLALRLAGVNKDKEVWTGSCPCQPFSIAGQGKGESDIRHLWPEFFRLIRERNPSTIFGEQVASAIGQGWIDGVFDDLEAQGYACGQAVLPSCSVGADDVRQRLYWVAYNTNKPRFKAHQKDVPCGAREPERKDSWTNYRRVYWREMARADWQLPSSWVIRDIDGLPGRVVASRGYGNAINPILAAEFIRAAEEARQDLALKETA